MQLRSRVRTDLTFMTFMSGSICVELDKKQPNESRGRCRIWLGAGVYPLGPDPRQKKFCKFIGSQFLLSRLSLHLRVVKFVKI